MLCIMLHVLEEVTANLLAAIERLSEYRKLSREKSPSVVVVGWIVLDHKQFSGAVDASYTRSLDVPVELNGKELVNPVKGNWYQI